MAIKRDPKAELTKALTSRIEEKAVREGLSEWLLRQAQARASIQVRSRAELLAFLGDSRARLRVVLRKSLESDSGFVLASVATEDGFILSDAAEGPVKPRTIRFADVALYQLGDEGPVASG